VSAGAVAVAWALGHPAVAGAIVGVRDQHQVENIVLASELALSEQDLAEIAAAIP
jgi:aryl-alcohol dehydrogenase-like predicted oxidoreductase